MTGGRCLCGAVTFTVEGPLAQPGACHCTECRKRSGHHSASTWVPRAALAVRGELRWYPWNARTRHAFCPTCGSQLFWERAGSDEISIEMAALDPGTGLKLASHDFAAEKGDYYDITDPLPVWRHTETEDGR